MAYGGGGGGRRGARGSGGGGGGRPFIWPPPPSTPRPVPMGGYRGPMVLPHQGAYGVLLAVYRPSGQAAPQVSFWPAPPAGPVTIRAPPPSPAAPSSTLPPPRQPALQSASAPASEPSPAALEKEVEKKLFVSETALAPPAAAAQGTAAAGADDALDLDLAPVSKKGLAHPARLGLATVGKKVMIHVNHFLVNVADNNLFHCDETMQMEEERVQASPALAAHLQLQTSPKPQVSKYYFKKKTSSDHSRNGKHDANHDSRIQPRSPLSRQSLTFDASPTYHAGAFYEIDHDKLPPKSQINLKSIRVVKVSECTNLDIMRSRDARFGALVMRQVLREEARKHIGDTGLLDHLLKHMAGRVPEGSIHRFRRRHNANGAMEYWLEPAELAEVRRQAGVSNPYWVPPPGWKPGDDVSLVAGDLLVKRQVEELTEEVNGVKRQMKQLMCKDDVDFDAERAYNSLKEKYQRAVRANEKLEKQGFCMKGGQDRLLRKSSFRVCKPARRMFSSYPHADTADLKHVFDAIGGPVNNCVHWPLNGPAIHSSFDSCIGHLRLYNCVHGQGLDVRSVLGGQKMIFTTAITGTLYCKVTYQEAGKQYYFKLIVDAKEGWNYGWENRNGVFEYSDSVSNPYMIDGIHVDFQSDYGPEGLCPVFDHESILLGPEPVRVWPCLVPNFYPQILLYKKKIPITSK